MKIICFSLDGDEIVYGLDNGEVYKFSYKTRNCTLILSLPAAVDYLNFFEDYNDLNNIDSSTNQILVAAATNGDYVVWCNDEILLYSKPVSTYSIRKIKFCVFLKEVRTFLVVKEKREMCLWHLNDTTEKCLLRENQHANIVSCTLSPSGKRFICLLQNGTFEMYRLIVNKQIEIELQQQKRLIDGGLRCCCFSYDEKLVAFSGENGGIVVSLFFILCCVFFCCYTFFYRYGMWKGKQRLLLWNCITML